MSAKFRSSRDPVPFNEQVITQILEEYIYACRLFLVPFNFGYPAQWCTLITLRTPEAEETKFKTKKMRRFNLSKLSKHCRRLFSKLEKTV